MAEKKRLTDRTLQSLKPAEPRKRYMVWDGHLRSFGVRVTDKGAISFIVMRRAGSKLVRQTLGNYPALTLEKARAAAEQALADLRQGITPAAKREASEAQRAAERRERELKARNSFSAVAEDFIRRHVSTLRTAKEVEAAIRAKLVTRWGTRPITSITKSDVIAALDEVIESSGQYAAHKLLAYCSKLFNWAIARDTYGLEHSPTDRIKPADVIGRKEARQRVLTDAELCEFWQATGKTEFPFGPLFRFLLLTGQRRDEAAEASWSEIDLEKRLWTIPPERMKAGSPHLVPLAPEAVDLLKSLPRFSGAQEKGSFVFTTTRGARPVSGFSKAKARLDAAMLEILRKEAVERGGDPAAVDLEDWRLHDLRRTARTHFSAIPAPDMVRELAISHTRPGLHKVYDRYAYLDEKRALFEAWAKRLMGIVDLPKGENIVRLQNVVDA